MSGLRANDFFGKAPYRIVTEKSVEEVRRGIEGKWEEGSLYFYFGTGGGQLFRGYRTDGGYVLGFLPEDGFSRYNAGPYVRLELEAMEGGTRVSVARVLLVADFLIFGVFFVLSFCAVLFWAPVRIWLPLGALSLVWMGAYGIVWWKMRVRLLRLLDGELELSRGDCV